jgi:hypothetical protein
MGYAAVFGRAILLLVLCTATAPVCLAGLHGYSRPYTPAESAPHTHTTAPSSILGGGSSAMLAPNVSYPTPAAVSSAPSAVTAAAQQNRGVYRAARGFDTSSSQPLSVQVQPQQPNSTPPAPTRSSSSSQTDPQYADPGTGGNVIVIIRKSGGFDEGGSSRGKGKADADEDEDAGEPGEAGGSYVAAPGRPDYAAYRAPERPEPVVDGSAFPSVLVFERAGR